jgi:hypothetical protein
MSQSNSLRLHGRMLALGLSALFCMSFSACGKKEEEDIQLFPVSGKVTISGTPMTMGQIMFNPNKDKGNTGTKVPSGIVQPDGSYTLRTGTATGTKEGAPPGWYKVTFLASGTSNTDMSKSKPPTFSSEFSDAKKSSLSVEVKEGADPKTYSFNIH